MIGVKPCSSRYLLPKILVLFELLQSQDSGGIHNEARELTCPPDARDCNRIDIFGTVGIRISCVFRPLSDGASFGADLSALAPGGGRPLESLRFEGLIVYPN